MFIDTAKTTVQAGKGGNGVNSFYRDKLTVKGHPDGGDGGNGGDVIIRVSTNVHTLIDFKYRHIFKAEKGTHGSSKQQRGRDGKNLVIEVPAGTLVYEADTRQLLKDLTKEGQEYIAARGGAGGRGNRSHKDATPGKEGEERALFLELKLIADVGIIGLPNAGKSTLLSRISKAHPRIASFAFTTKNPILGVVEFNETRFKAAEIPGLIEGSHKGRGLGDRFLRHSERTKIFVHLLDLSGNTVEEIFSNYCMINNELEFYSKRLSQKQQVIAGNKLDIEGAEEKLKVLRIKLGKEILGISAKEGTGIEELVRTLASRLA